MVWAELSKLNWAAQPPPPPRSAHSPSVPRKALGMVILSHIRSRTSRPDSGEAIALVTEAMSVWMERLKSSKPKGKKTRGGAGGRAAECLCACGES